MKNLRGRVEVVVGGRGGGVGAVAGICTELEPEPEMSKMGGSGNQICSTNSMGQSHKGDGRKDTGERRRVKGD